MSLKSSNKIDVNRWELEIEVGAEEFQKAINNVYKKKVKKISIPGFRKGKAPKAFIEKYYGENVFYEDAINDLYPDVFSAAIEELGLDVINDKVDFDLIKADKEGLEFKVAVTVKPEAEVNGYKGIEVKTKSIDVTEEEIDKEIQAVRERNARIITVENRSVKSGDIAVIDFKGFIDGNAFQGGEDKNHNLEIGSGAFIPGFEEQIIGRNAGDEIDVTVKFPEDYQAKDIAGKEANFEVKLHEIKEKELPELDNDFVADVSEFDTLTEYKEDIKSQILERKEKQEKEDCDNQIVDKLVELLKAEIPEAMFKNRVDQDIKDFERNLKSQGIDIDTYFKYTGMNQEGLRKNFSSDAKRQVKLELALEKIAKMENIKPSEGEIEDRYNELSEKYKIEKEKVKKMIQVEDIERELILSKTFDFIRENMIKIDN